MNSEKGEFVLNRRQAFFCLFFLLCAAANIVLILLKEDGVFIWISLVFSFVILSAFTVFLPYGYRFNENGAEILYLFGFREAFRWVQVRDVILELDYPSSFLSVYRFYGPWERKYRFMCGEINRNRKTKRMIEKYYKKIEEKT